VRGRRIRLIDRRARWKPFLHKIRSTGVLLTEAMHGAIVADALRVPGSPCDLSRPSIASSARLDPVNRRALQASRALPSSLRELWVYGTGYEGKGKFTGNLSASRSGASADAALIQSQRPTAAYCAA